MANSRVLRAKYTYFLCSKADASQVCRARYRLGLITYARLCKFIS